MDSKMLLFLVKGFVIAVLPKKAESVYEDWRDADVERMRFVMRKESKARILDELS